MKLTLRNVTITIAEIELDLPGVAPPGKSAAECRHDRMSPVPAASAANPTVGGPSRAAADCGASPEPAARAVNADPPAGRVSPHASNSQGSEVGTLSNLDRLIAESKARVNAMTVAEREAMYAAQRESYVRAEMAMGSDADEAAYRADLSASKETDNGSEGRTEQRGATDDEGRGRAEAAAGGARGALEPPVSGEGSRIGAEDAPGGRDADSGSADERRGEVGRLHADGQGRDEAGEVGPAPVSSDEYFEALSDQIDQRPIGVTRRPHGNSGGIAPVSDAGITPDVIPVSVLDEPSVIAIREGRVEVAPAPDIPTVMETIGAQVLALAANPPPVTVIDRAGELDLRRPPVEEDDLAIPAFLDRRRGLA